MSIDPFFLFCIFDPSTQPTNLMMQASNTFHSHWNGSYFLRGSMHSLAESSLTEPSMFLGGMDPTRAL
jgi:hypothetical protein